MVFSFLSTTAADPKSLPQLYKSNTAKEKLVLSYCENFRRQFVHLYRDRKPLFLNPLNECEVEVHLYTSILCNHKSSYINFVV